MNTVDDFFGPEGPLAKTFDGYELREQQLEFAQAIEMAINEKTPLIGEAPTGVGKSLAALVPAFQAIKKGKRVLVVTSSILLQEQYFYKDVPMLEKLFGLSVSPVLIKGKSNYLCMQKAVSSKAEGLRTDDQAEYVNILEWAKKTKTGDKSELDIEPKGSVWSRFAITEESECSGKQCPMYKQCHYYRERFKMESAKMIICNYHYLFTAFENGMLLPSDIGVVIMDEGHEAVGIARDMTKKDYNINSYKRMNEKLLRAQEKVRQSGTDIAIDEELEFMYFFQTLTAFFTDVAKYFYDHKPKYRSAWTLGKADKNYLNEISKSHMDAFENTLANMESYIEECGLNQEIREEWEDYYTEEQIEFQLALENYFEWMIEKKVLLEFLFGHTKEYQLDPDGVDRIVWLEEYGNNSVSIKSQATDAAPITGKFFKDDEAFILNAATPIFISATMAVNQDFNHIKKDLGVSGDLIECIVDSPFDLTSNMLWYLPKDVVDGSSVDEHAIYSYSEMERVVKAFDGRTMCLFTSMKSMRSAALHLEGTLPKHIQVLVQGKIPKKRIIEIMRKNPHTVIVATRSFFTGVDIQGSNLSAVLIDKLPFPMIGDPVNEHLMDQANGFYNFTIPEAITILKQAFGRLNRTTTDRGVVALLDRRLATAGYKRRIFNSFGHKLNTTRDFNDVLKMANEVLHDE